jgi:proteasome lid subunit RPN8/RPN11
MIRIETEPWRKMVEHARATYPYECCGAMLGTVDGDGRKVVTRAMPLENASEGEKRVHYVMRPKDMLMADQEARREGLDIVGFYHSHPDCDAYFSETDRKNSYWYSFVVMSVRKGEFDHANSYIPNADQTDFEKEELIY